MYFTSLEFERLTNAAGPTGGKVVLRDGVTQPKSVGIIHCVGSATELSTITVPHLLYAGLEVCPPGARKNRRDSLPLLYRHAHPYKSYDEFYQKVLEEGTLTCARQSGGGHRRGAPSE
jgi:heterodisulfide reductase subunit A2